MSYAAPQATNIESTAFRIQAKLDLQKQLGRRMLITDQGPLYGIELSGDTALNTEALEYLHRTGRLPWYRYIDEQRLLLASLPDGR